MSRRCVYPCAQPVVTAGINCLQTTTYTPALIKAYKGLGILTGYTHFCTQFITTSFHTKNPFITEVKMQLSTSSTQPTITTTTYINNYLENLATSLFTVFNFTKLNQLRYSNSLSLLKRNPS